MGKGILLEREGAVARLILDRPTHGNALDLGMSRALLEAAVECSEDPSIRCVLMTGNGRLFCAGGDIAAFAAAGDRLPDYLEDITTAVHEAVLRLARMKKPLVTAVNGPAAGAGIGLALLGDIALAAPEAHFTLAYTAIGMTPDAGASWLLPRLIGMRQAQELCLRNTRVNAADAARIGLVTRVTEAGRLADDALSLATELAAGATGALGETRRLLLEGATSNLEQHLAAEARTIAGRGRSADGLEGIYAFVEKRRPKFEGVS